MPKTPPTEELRAWLRLSLEPGLGPAQARALLAAIGLPQDIYALPAASLVRHVPPELAHQLRRPPSAETAAAIDRTMEWLEQPGHHILTLADPDYPRALLDIHDPPLLLYANGNVGLLSRPCLAVVGARSATPGGTDNARAFARHLAAQGWSIVSGLALGIDAAAHDGALQAGPEGGSTIAVLGTGIDIVYPARHRSLAHQVAEHGVLISELPLGTRALPYQFPKRNRLVAGLCGGVLVVEAARQSGSLITARLAGELGREVFAIPGSIHSPLSRGCHALIRQGAKLVESAEDIYEELRGPIQGKIPVPVPSPRVSRDAGATGRLGRRANAASSKPATGVDHQRADTETRNADATSVLDALGYDPVHPDILVQRTGMDVTRLTTTLLDLELGEVITRLSDGCYQRL